MQGESNTKSKRDLKQWSEELVCPVCLAALRFADSDVTCSGCGRIYPVVDGIAVLIRERATEPPQ